MKVISEANLWSMMMKKPWKVHLRIFIYHYCVMYNILCDVTSASSFMKEAWSSFWRFLNICVVGISKPRVLKQLQNKLQCSICFLSHGTYPKTLIYIDFQHISCSSYISYWCFVSRCTKYTVITWTEQFNILCSWFPKQCPLVSEHCLVEESWVITKSDCTLRTQSPPCEKASKSQVGKSLEEV